MLKIGKPRIAVCFSGQPRTWRKCVESWQKNLFGHHEIDVFCHAWDFNSQPNCISVGKVNVDTPVTKEELDDLFAVLKPKKAIVESTREFPLLNPKQPVNQSSFLSQYYGIMQAARLKRQYEIDNDFQYDIVIKMRYDAFINTPVVEEFNSNDIDQHSMYCFHFGWSHLGNVGRIGDIFWYASSETYDIIADFYLNVGTINSTHFLKADGSLKDNLLAESVFYYYNKKNDINYKLNHWDIKLYRESKELAFSKDLNGFEIW